MQINQQNVGFFSVNNLKVPEEGPKSIPLLLDFTVTNVYTLDLQNIVDRKYISMIQSVFLDNALGGVHMSVTDSISGQKILIAPNRQGYFMFLCGNPPRLTFFSDSNQILKVQLLNFPVTNHDWPTITGA